MMLRLLRVPRLFKPSLGRLFAVNAEKDQDKFKEEEEEDQGDKQYDEYLDAKEKLQRDR